MVCAIINRNHPDNFLESSIHVHSNVNKNVRWRPHDMSDNFLEEIFKIAITNIATDTKIILSKLFNNLRMRNDGLFIVRPIVSDWQILPILTQIKDLISTNGNQMVDIGSLV